MSALAEEVVVHLSAEVESGNVEYKLKLMNLGEERRTHLATQMNWRLNEGEGNAVYHVGVTDDGFTAGLSDDELSETLRNLREIAQLVDARVADVRVRAGAEGKAAEAHVRRRRDASDGVDAARVAVVGAVGAGKSTLVGVLSSGELDNGRGLARMQVLRHNHEVESGKTSSISTTVLGFDANGSAMELKKRQRLTETRALSAAAAPQRLLTVLDCAGSERYLKTTVLGLSAGEPDYILLLVDAERGLERMTREHLGVALALHLPLCVVISRVDAAPAARLQRTWSAVQAVLRSRAAGECRPALVRTEGDAERVCSALSSEMREASLKMCEASSEVREASSEMREAPLKMREASLKMREASSEMCEAPSEMCEAPSEMREASLKMREAPSEMREAEGAREQEADKENAAPPRTVPCFHVSSVSGAGMKALRAFLLRCPPRAPPSGTGTEVRVEDVFHVEGAGNIFLGTIRRGRVRAGGALFLGPNAGGAFDAVRVASIHVNGAPVDAAAPGQQATLLLRGGGGGGGGALCALNAPESARVWRSRKGLVLLGTGSAQPPRAALEFEAEVVLLRHPNGVVSGYEPVIHAKGVRQSARLVEILPGGACGPPGAEGAIPPGGRAVCRFRFLYRPEYLTIGSKFLFREGCTRGVGSIVGVSRLP